MLFHYAVTNVSPKYVSCMGRDIPQGHDNKISRPLQVLRLNKKQLKENH